MRSSQTQPKTVVPPTHGEAAAAAARFERRGPLRRLVRVGYSAGNPSIETAFSERT